MPYKTYLLPDGGFATSSVNVPTAYIHAWDITDAQAAEIEHGAHVLVEGDQLMIIPAPLAAEEMLDVPADGEF